VSAEHGTATPAPYADAGLPLPYAVTLPVLGIATRFATNDRAMLEIVDEAFGVWRELPPPEPRDGARSQVEVRIVMSGPRDEDASRSAAAIHHSMSNDLRFVARCADGSAETDPARHLVVVRASAALAADRARFRTQMLEAAVLAVLSCYDRHPVHAAAVAHRGHALLLAAPSGTGKSTLAYACHAHGLDLLGDDHVRVQLEPSPRVWGWPARVRLLAETAARMGARYTPPHALDPKGKSVIDARAGMSASRLVADEAAVCVLSRDGGPLALEPLAPADIARAMEDQLAPGFDRFPARWPSVVRALSARGGWRLNLSHDPHEAVAVVRDLLSRQSRRA
jgi:hypothetical protein